MSWRNIVFAAVTCLLAVLSAVGCSKAAPEAQASTIASSSDPASALVQRFKMGADLESIANQVAVTTTTFLTLAQKHGAAEAKQLVRSEISKSIPAYQTRWNQNLASIYSKHFTADELRSLSEQGTSSPHFAKFRSTQATVAAEMRAASSPLLQELVTEALSNAAKQ